MRPRRRAAALLWSAAAACSGCAAVDLRDKDWNALHEAPPRSPIPAMAREQGFASCRNLLADAVLHAIGDTDHFAWGGGATADTNRRPVSFEIVAGQGRDTEHAVVNVGLDASGKCFAYWRTTRVWPLGCATLHAKSEWLGQYDKAHDIGQHSTTYRSEGSGITVVLTDLGRRRCLMTAAETAYWQGEGADLDLSTHSIVEDTP